MKRIFKIALSVLLSALTLFGATACGKVETPQFIKEYLCVEHTYGPGEVERWATCLREGKVKHTCTECGHVKFEVLEKSNHTPYAVPAREATCAQTGYNEHTACAVCGVVMNNSKTTLAKIPCSHENDFYAGMGIYECGLCGDERMQYREYVMSDSSDFYKKEISANNAWYRFYLPKEGAKASIKFVNRADRVPFGNCEINEIYSLTMCFDFAFLKEQDSYIALGNGQEQGICNYWCDTEIEFGPDYVDICFGESSFELYHEDCSGGANDCWFKLSSDIAKVENVSVEGGAKIVLLEGVTSSQRP